MERKSSLKVRVQKLGTSLSNMVMPNIGAFIAWGLQHLCLLQQVTYPIKL